MAEDTNPQPFSLGGDLEAALVALESTLATAGSAVATMRTSLPQIALLTQTMSEVEATLASARRQIEESFRAPSVAGAMSGGTTHDVQPTIPTPDPTSEEHAGAESPCLLVELRTRDGALDLKTVDSAVNEHPTVVDVALLEYDGSHASLKVWLQPSADASSVRETLLESLAQRFANEDDTEVRIELDTRSAA